MSVRFLLSLLFGCLLSAQAWALDEGIDFTILPNPQPTETGDKIEVLEVFMYSCPHCFHLEPTLEKWRETQPANVAFRRMPAVFSTKPDLQAQAFYAAELLGAQEKFTLAMFDAIHVKKQKISDENVVVTIAEGAGIDGAEFRKALNSFDVNMKVNRARNVTKNYGIDGVPAVVVNGKYRTSPSQTGSREGLVKVIDQLIARETGGS
ncbi:MAG: thiol:disulfide interchange protein DsbA/DsbL [Chromatiaceae bacterium]|nr:thiol:disulfide interchange protein DsbA/DsbL [Chromatiaceae bacterium]MBP6260861.1 thiol:disulfide interchange protein DsbA/DsbL [Chromatiaceae bacterium]MBP8024003.1 thiol:disulfide interchange protein DsbA/DsbL [Chromatiaceae bacterium]